MYIYDISNLRVKEQRTHSTFSLQNWTRWQDPFRCILG